MGVTDEAQQQSQLEFELYKCDPFSTHSWSIPQELVHS